jgi:4-hydroxybenzoate polyprenyltransferase
MPGDLAHIAPYQQAEDHSVPLCVDLDGTVVRSDTLLESVLSLVRSDPLSLLRLPLWLMGGRAHLKEEVAKRAAIDVSTLPYNTELLEHVRAERASGRPIILVTGANIATARKIADHLDLFDEIHASDERTNLTGAKKLQLLRSTFGDNKFDYAANAKVDLAVWPYSRRGILVNASSSVRRRAESLVEVDRVFNREPVRPGTLLKAARVQQWLKNLLLFLPLAAAHMIFEVELFVQASMAFLAFGLCASSVYLLNDLVDLQADRQHPSKRNRPFAAGALPISTGIAVMLGLLVSAFIVAALLPGTFFGVLAGYYLLTCAYSFYLKRVVLLDVWVLAGLYTIRVIAGGMAVGVPISFWLLAFSVFFFLGLAMLKRYSELLQLMDDQNESTPGRGYRDIDAGVLLSLGPASGFASVLVLALYINSENVTALYAYPELIWLVCPLVLFWTSRAWLVARRGEMHDDPIVYAIRDRGSLLVGLGSAAVLLLAT